MPEWTHCPNCHSSLRRGRDGVWYCSSRVSYRQVPAPVRPGVWQMIDVPLSSPRHCGWREQLTLEEMRQRQREMRVAEDEAVVAMAREAALMAQEAALTPEERQQRDDVCAQAARASLLSAYRNVLAAVPGGITAKPIVVRAAANRKDMLPRAFAHKGAARHSSGRCVGVYGQCRAWALGCRERQKQIWIAADGTAAFVPGKELYDIFGRRKRVPALSWYVDVAAERTSQTFTRPPGPDRPAPEAADPWDVAWLRERILDGACATGPYVIFRS